MENRAVIPDRKLLARLVLIREEARGMMGGGILDERNDRGFSTLPESEVHLTPSIYEQEIQQMPEFCLLFVKTSPIKFIIVGEFPNKTGSFEARKNCAANDKKCNARER